MAAVRAQLQTKPGTRLVWSVTPDGTIIVRPKTKSIPDIAGMVKSPRGKRVAIDDMSPWRCSADSEPAPIVGRTRP